MSRVCAEERKRKDPAPGFEGLERRSPRNFCFPCRVRQGGRRGLLVGEPRRPTAEGVVDRPAHGPTRRSAKVATNSKEEVKRPRPLDGEGSLFPARTWVSIGSPLGPSPRQTGTTLWGPPPSLQRQRSLFVPSQFFFFEGHPDPDFDKNKFRV